MADRLHELDQRFKEWVNFRLTFRLKGLPFTPLQHDTIYAYLLNHVNVYVLDGTSWEK